MVTGMIELYNDQKIAVENILNAYRKGYKSPLLVAPCGFGKTVVFAHVAARARAKGNKTIICVHRQELLRQTCATLARLDVPFGVIAAGLPTNIKEPVQVASIHTLARRLEHYEAPDIIVIDEAHHAVANTWKAVVEAYSTSRILGVTATPWRANGEGLKKVFDAMIIGAMATDLINRGRLAKPIYYAPPQIAQFDDVRTRMGDYQQSEIDKRMDKPHITGDAINHYNRICPNARAVVFCTSCRHADHVAADFTAAGIPAASIDGALSDTDRKQRIDDLASGKIRILTSCELISEGFDLPSVETAIMLRPTQSLAVWIQQAGRALRTAPNKVNAHIIDHVGNVFRHGAIEHITDWSLDGAPAKVARNKEVIPNIRRCKNCFVVYPTSLSSCPECGAASEKTRKEIMQQEGELRALALEEIKAKRTVERKSAHSLHQLILLGQSRGYKNPYLWAQRVYDGRIRKAAAMGWL
jgi:superfamily II DNA or RNA helicase